MRWLIGLLLTSALLAGGLFTLYCCAFTASSPNQHHAAFHHLLGIGLALTTLGGAWLWADYLSPLVRGRPGEF